jgi:hypothetical protein
MREPIGCFLIDELKPGANALAGLHAFLETEDDVQDAFTAQIHIFFIQFALLHGFHDLAVVDAAGGGHFQVEARGHALDAVADRAPVGHDVALEAPFLAQHVGEQPGVFAGIDAV